MTQLETETMTAIRNYCRRNTPCRQSVRLALASEFALKLIEKSSSELTEEEIASRARALADALMAECEKGDEA